MFDRLCYGAAGPPRITIGTVHLRIGCSMYAICVYTYTLTHICFCMHAMYVCMYLGMYVCMYVCIRLSLSLYLSICLPIYHCLSIYLSSSRVLVYSSAYIRKHIIHTCVQGCGSGCEASTSLPDGLPLAVLTPVKHALSKKPGCGKTRTRHRSLTPTLPQTDGLVSGTYNGPSRNSGYPNSSPQARIRNRSAAAGVRSRISNGPYNPAPQTNNSQTSQAPVGQTSTASRP